MPSPLKGSCSRIKGFTKSINHLFKDQYVLSESRRKNSFSKNFAYVIICGWSHVRRSYPHLGTIWTHSLITWNVHCAKIKKYQWLQLKKPGLESCDLKMQPHQKKWRLLLASVNINEIHYILDVTCIASDFFLQLSFNISPALIKIPELRYTVYYMVTIIV